MNSFKAVACGLALCGVSLAAAAIPAVSDTDAQAVRVKRAQAPMAIFGGGARLGVTVRDIEDTEVKTAKLSAPAGAVVEEVSESSAAEAGGIRKGDVIVEFDGERVRSARQLTRLVQETADGRKVTAVVVRDGQRVNLTVEPRQSGPAVFEKFREFEDVGRAFNFDVVPPSPVRTPRASPPAVWNFDGLLGPANGRLGLTVETLSPQLAEYFGTKEGVLVKSVQDNSAASKIGIRAGDVITSINGSTIDDADELRRLLQSLHDGAEVTVGIMRDKKAQTLKGKVEGTVRRRTYRSTI
jgi:serine protease Do